MNDRRKIQLAMEGIDVEALEDKTMEIVHKLAADGATLKEGQHIAKIFDHILLKMEKCDPNEKLSEIID